MGRADSKHHERERKQSPLKWPKYRLSGWYPLYGEFPSETNSRWNQDKSSSALTSQKSRKICLDIRQTFLAALQQEESQLAMSPAKSLGQPSLKDSGCASLDSIQWPEQTPTEGHASPFFLLLVLQSEAGCQQFILQSSLTSTVLVWSSKATSALMTCKSWCHHLRAQTAHWCWSSIYLRGPLPPQQQPTQSFWGSPSLSRWWNPTTCRRKRCKGEKEPPTSLEGSLGPDKTCRNWFPQEPLVGDGSITMSWRALWEETTDQIFITRWSMKDHKQNPPVLIFFLRWVRDRWERALYPSTSSLQPSLGFPSCTIP